MSVELRSAKKTIYLVGAANHQITGAKLPSNRQILAVLFFNIQEVKLTVSESANLVIRECILFGEKARIPTKSSPNCVKKLVDLHHVWRELQKIVLNPKIFIGGGRRNSKWIWITYLISHTRMPSK